MFFLGGICVLLSFIGLVPLVAGWLLLRVLCDEDPALPSIMPVTVLKPLHGDEPMLEEALATLLSLRHAGMQVVFGVQRGDDPALAVLDRLQARFPDADVHVTVDDTVHGSNPKVSNLINMLPAAKHDLIVIADSDVWCREDYIDRIVETLHRPGVGLVTLPYVGIPAGGRVAGRLGAAWINQAFLPGVLLSRMIGRRDCLGATMALTRETLNRIGGLESVANDLADDAVLGRRVRALGLEVALAPTLVGTTVGERSIEALMRHEIRWGRTMRTLEPTGYLLSALQYPLGWALLAVLVSGPAFLPSMMVVWVARHIVGRGIDRTLRRFDDRLAMRTRFWLHPLRDALSMIVLVAAHAGRTVDWRGRTIHTAPPSTGPRP